MAKVIVTVTVEMESDSKFQLAQQAEAVRIALQRVGEVVDHCGYYGGKLESVTKTDLRMID